MKIKYIVNYPNGLCKPVYRERKIKHTPEIGKINKKKIMKAVKTVKFNEYYPEKLN